MDHIFRSTKAMTEGEPKRIISVISQSTMEPAGAGMALSRSLGLLRLRARDKQRLGRGGARALSLSATMFLQNVSIPLQNGLPVNHFPPP